MLMHFPVDPVMSVFSGVRVGSHRNECLLLMWEFRLWCMSKTRTTSKGPVGDRCVTVNLEPTRTSNFLRKQQEADSDLKFLIVGRKTAIRKKPLWEDVLPQSCATKTLWSQWDWSPGAISVGTNNTPKRKRCAPSKQYEVGAHMKRFAIDILSPLPESPRKKTFMLVVSDYFTKWTETGYPIPNQEAITVAEKL